MIAPPPPVRHGQHVQAPSPQTAAFTADIVSPSTGRKTTVGMAYSESSTGPTLLDWRSARDLKLGSDLHGVFHPSHAVDLAYKKCTISLQLYAGFETLRTVGPPASGRDRGQARPSVQVYVFRPPKGFHIAATDLRGRHVSAHLRELCVAADNRAILVPQSLAGPELTGRWRPELRETGTGPGIVWGGRPTSADTQNRQSGHGAGRARAPQSAR